MCETVRQSGEVYLRVCEWDLRAVDWRFINVQDAGEVPGVTWLSRKFVDRPAAVRPAPHCVYGIEFLLLRATRLTRLRTPEPQKM